MFNSRLLLLPLLLLLMLLLLLLQLHHHYGHVRQLKSDVHVKTEGVCIPTAWCVASPGEEECSSQSVSSVPQVHTD